MFGIRAKALIVFTVVSIVLNEKGKTESASNTQFRCNFKNKDYKLDTNIPMWSEMGTPTELELYDNDFNNTFVEFQKLVGQAMTNVMEKNSLNNVDQFIRFIQAYKNQTGIKNQKSLEDFFKDYHVPFQPHEDPVSFLVAINTELTKLYPKATDRMYMVSAYADPPEKFFKDVLKYENSGDMSNLYNLFGGERVAYAELTKTQFQRHVAGIIKVKVIKSMNRTATWTYNGIIIVDPGYISGNEPVNPYSVLKMDYGFADAELLYPAIKPYRMGPLDISKSIHNNIRNKFALVTVTPSTQTPHKVLYLKYKPFCSFMDSTTKGNLLAPYHRILSYNQDGSQRGYLKFDVVPEYISKVSSPIISLGFFNRTTDLKTKVSTGSASESSFNFDSIKPAKISSENRDKINEATNYLSLKPDYNLLGKLQTIQSLVFEDPDLVKNIYELNIRLNEKPKGCPVMGKIMNLFQRSC